MVDKYLSRLLTYRTRLISYYFFYFKGVIYLFSIGKTFKEAREMSGVSIEEASHDLNIKSVILENIEAGSIGGFKDIFELKNWISSYAKYLGLDETKMIDEFNEYMFEYTSKIPIKEIEKQVMEQNKEKQEEKVVSPYTNPTIKSSKKGYILIYIGLIIAVILIIFWSASQVA